jgi:hypothetical protein
MANNFNATILLSVGSGTYLLNEQFQCGYVSEYVECKARVLNLSSLVFTVRRYPARHRVNRRAGFSAVQ